MPVPAGGDDFTDLYTDLPTVKTALGKLTADDRDELIEASIRAACRWIDRRTGRRFYADQTASARTFPVVGRSLCSGRDQVLLVDDIASTTDLAVASGGSGNWTALTNWETGPDNALAYGRAITQIYSTSGWLPKYGRIQVTARWGWPTTPDEIAEASRLLAARLYRRKDSPQGVISSGDWGTVRVSRVDPDVEALVSAYELPAIA